MTEQQYKKHTVLYTISAILFIVTFFAALLLLVLMQEFRLTILLAFYILVALISLGYFVGFLIWSFTNKEGREYWVIYFKRKNLAIKGNRHLFTTKPGEHPADKMKVIVMQGASLILALILLSTFLFR